MKRVCHPVSHVIFMLVSTSTSHFQSTTTRSTTWTARPSPRRLYTEHLFQNFYSRQAALKNHVNYESGGNPRTNTPTNTLRGDSTIKKKTATREEAQHRFKQLSVKNCKHFLQRLSMGSPFLPSNLCLQSRTEQPVGGLSLRFLPSVTR